MPHTRSHFATKTNQTMAAVQKKMKIVQRADNQILFYWFRKE